MPDPVVEIIARDAVRRFLAYLYNTSKLLWFMDAHVLSDHHEEHAPVYIREKLKLAVRGIEAFAGRLDEDRMKRFIDKAVALGGSERTDSQRFRQRHDRYLRYAFCTTLEEANGYYTEYMKKKERA